MSWNPMDQPTGHFVDKPEFLLSGEVAKSYIEAVKQSPNYEIEKELLGANLEEIIEQIKQQGKNGTRLHVVDLGWGDGLKTAEIIRKLLDHYEDIEICLVNTSEYVLDCTEENIESIIGKEGTRITKVRSEFESLKRDEAYQGFLDSADNSLHICLNSTLSLLKPEQIKKIMSQIVTKNAIVGMQVYNEIPGMDQALSDQYFNSQMRDVFYGILKALDFPEEFDANSLRYCVSMAINIHKSKLVSGLNRRLEPCFEVLSPSRKGLFRYKKGDIILAPKVYFFTNEQIHEILGNPGFKIREYLHEKKQHGIYLISNAG